MFNHQPNGKILLFLGGPIDALPSIAYAWSLGYSVIVVDGNKDCPGIQWCKKFNQWRMVADVYNGQEVIDKLLNWKIDGVLAVATDVGPVVSQVAEYLDLPHIPYEISKLGWNKLELKEYLHSKDIPVASEPWLVCKPIYQGRGATGVEILDTDPLEIENFGDKYPTLMYEQFIFGPQVSAECIVWDNQIVFCGYTDRDYSNGYPVEVGGYGPSQFEHYKNIKQSLDDLVSNTIKALGMQSGTVKFDLVLDEYRRYMPVIIEIAIGRLSGGLMCSHYLPLAYGVNFLEMAFDVACGISPTKIIKEKKIKVRGYYQNKDANIHKERGKFKMELTRCPY